MSSVSIQDVKKIRDLTGVGVIDARQSLIDSGGDFAGALAAMKLKGAGVSAKKAGRATTKGLVHSYVHMGRIGVLIEVGCETDFVSKTKEFTSLAHDLAVHVAATGSSSITELLGEPFVKDPEFTVQELVNDVIARLGENIVIKQLARIEMGDRPYA